MKEEYYCTRAENGFYSKELIDLAKRRIKDLLHKSRLDTVPLSTIVESAYLIGMMDGSNAERERHIND